MITELQKTYLDLLRLGLGNVRAVQLPMVVDWSGLQALAEEQGLSAVVLDGIEKLPDDIRPAKIELLQLIGEVLQGYEYRYDSYCKAISELAAFYNSNGFKMMVLKGYACSLDWPKPEHRPCGDIDIWLFGRQQEADKALGSWFKVQGLKTEIDKSHLHHTVFNWGEFMVENHFEIVDTKSSKSNAKIEKLFLELGLSVTQIAQKAQIRDGSTVARKSMGRRFICHHQISMRYFYFAMQYCISIRMG